MPFPPNEVTELLAAVHRRCCICHRWCGVKMETDHMTPSAEGGSDSIENAIPVCFECHAEIHAYNDKHPRGRKFRPEELRLHKEQWLEVCRNRPEQLAGRGNEPQSVGPIQALVDELDYNRTVGGRIGDPRVSGGRGATFMTDHFKSAIAAGGVSMLDEDLRSSLLAAYAAAGRANHWIEAEMDEWVSHYGMGRLAKHAGDAVTEAGSLIEEAYRQLLRFLGSE